MSCELEKGPRYVAAFRAYNWDESIASLARRFFGACENARHVVLADETRGSLKITEFEVVSHTSDTAALSLPKIPVDNSLWFNVDYGIYILQNALPGFQYYVLSESDLAVNSNVDAIVDAARDREIAFVAHDMRMSTPEWRWHENGLSAFDAPMRSLLFFMVVSEDAAVFLLKERRALAQRYRTGQLSEWTFCEPFVPTVLARAGMRLANLDEFVDTRDLNFRPRIALDDPRASRPGTLVHSVLSKDSYIRALLKDFHPREWLITNSEMRLGLERQDFGDYVHQLKTSFEIANDHAGLREFTKEMRSRGYKMAVTPDLAYCKPALVSSTSTWSRSQDAQQEAGGANGVTFYDDFGFHTDAELAPWWMVDLGEGYLVDEIHILNREQFAERFTSFWLQSSVDASTWITRFSRNDASPVSSDINNPFVFSASDPFFARYVRIVIFGYGILHLRRVRIYGREVAVRADAK